MVRQLKMFSVTLLLFSFCWSQIICQVVLLPSTEVSKEPISSYFDYILKFSFELNEEQVAPYFIRLIYNESTTHTISTDDVLNLSKVKILSLDETQSALNKMNISSEKIFNIQAVETFLTELNIPFKDIYGRVTAKLNILGPTLRQFLTDLSIDAATFSSVVSFGPGDGFDEFKKGNFTKESLEGALIKVSKTLEELFVAIRDEYVLYANSTQRPTIVQKLNKYNFGERSALSLWNVLNLTLEDVRKVPNLNYIITNTTAKLNASKIVGILTGPYEAVVNLASYSIWKDEVIVKVIAESFSNKSKLLGRWVVNQIALPNIVKLSMANMNVSSDNVTYAATGSSSELNLINCTFVTVENGTLVANFVSDSHNHENEIHIMNSTIENSQLVLGSPLICQDSVFGLAKLVNDTTLFLDTFYVDSHVHGGGSSITIINNLLYPFVLAILMSYIFWTG